MYDIRISLLLKQNQLKLKKSDYDSLVEKYETYKENSENIKNELTIKVQDLEDRYAEINDNMTLLKDQCSQYVFHAFVYSLRHQKEKIDAFGDVTPDYIQNLQDNVSVLKQMNQDLVTQIETSTNIPTHLNLQVEVLQQQPNTLLMNSTSSTNMKAFITSPKTLRLRAILLLKIVPKRIPMSCWIPSLSSLTR